MATNNAINLSNTDFTISSGAAELNDAVVKTVVSDSGSATPSTHGFTIAGSGGITTSGTSATITVDGSGVAGAGGTWVLIETQTISGTPATVDFETGIDGTYDSYIFVLKNVIPSTDSGATYMRIGTGGTPTYQTGGAAYSWAHDSGAGSTAAQISLVDVTAGNDTGESGFSGHIAMIDPSSSAVSTSFTWYSSITNVAGNASVTVGAGSYLATTAVTAVRFYYHNGNTESGVISLYGITSS